MKNIIIVFIYASFLLSSNLVAQVTIAQEFGISYAPFSLTGGESSSSNRFDLLFGINAELPIAKSWILNTRFAYVSRENIRWHPHITPPIYEYEELNNKDFNIDIALSYHMSRIFLS